MDWGFLWFLSEPWFVIPWYVIGGFGAVYVIYDETKVNTPLKTAIKWAWPIIILFFSVIGLALYFGTARAPGIGKKNSKNEKKQLHHTYEQNLARRVNGAVIHCVAGDGLGIMTGMVIARATGMNFWQEFWFEYLVGFLFGWLIFQFKSMTMMTSSASKALLMSFRAEFFSMLSVMGGMGATMAYLTPMVVTQQPRPLTYAFWGFGMLGLIIGFIFTYPMNTMMVLIGWKHGMGGMNVKQEVKKESSKIGIVFIIIMYGLLIITLPAWLIQARQGRLAGAGIEQKEKFASKYDLLIEGTCFSINSARANLSKSQRPQAMHALEAAWRASNAGRSAIPGTLFEVYEIIENARHDIAMGEPEHAIKKLDIASMLACNATPVGLRKLQPEYAKYAGATVVNANGLIIGEMKGITNGRMVLELRGIHDFMGFIDISKGQKLTLPPDSVIFGPNQLTGESIVVLPTFEFPSTE
jgi:hypothetical protein